MRPSAEGEWMAQYQCANSLMLASWQTERTGTLLRLLNQLLVGHVIERADIAYLSAIND